MAYKEKQLAERACWDFMIQANHYESSDEDIFEESLEVGEIRPELYEIQFEDQKESSSKSK